jgi:hypothetical protein
MSSLPCDVEVIVDSGAVIKQSADGRRERAACTQARAKGPNLPRSVSTASTNCTALVLSALVDERDTKTDRIENHTLDLGGFVRYNSDCRK